MEARFHKIINENNMVGEDYRSQAYANLQKVLQYKLFNQKGEQIMGELKSELQHFRLKSNRLEEALKFKTMEAEDYLSTLIRNEDFIKNFNNLTKELRYTIEDKEEVIRKKDGALRGRDSEIDRLKEALQGGQDIIEDSKKKIEELEL